MNNQLRSIIQKIIDKNKALHDWQGGAIMFLPFLVIYIFLVLAIIESFLRWCLS